MKNSYQLKEQSNRLGLRKDTLTVFYRGVVMDKIENGKLVIQQVFPEDEYQAELNETEFSRTLGYKMYELTNHLGNVLSTITDRKILHTENDLFQNYQADIVQQTRYYPFGMLMDFGDSGVYRFGFNTQEITPEIHPNHYTAEYWEYDSRLGRRWNVDSNVNPAISSYAVFAGNPIWFSDPLGDTIRVEGSKRDIKTFARQLSRTTGNKCGVDDGGNLYNKREYDNTETTKRKSGELSGIVRTVMDEEEVFHLDLTRMELFLFNNRYYGVTKFKII